MNRQVYEAARAGAVWREMSHFGRFRGIGQDAATLLHHLTTNDIKGLKPGTGCDAALINHKARLLDWLTIYRLPQELLVVTSPNRRATFGPHAQKFILFRQDVRLDDITDATALLGLCGPLAVELFATFVPGGDALAGAALNELRDFATPDVSFQAARTRRLPGDGILLMAADAVGLSRLIEDSGLPVCDAETFNVLRVEAGLPVAGLELTEAINPWEAGFDDLISLSKGCYNGQEVIARLHTYKKVKQGLCGLKLETALPPGQEPRLQADGREAGFITSAAESPTFGPIALGYVRGAWQEPGQRLEVLTDNASQTATVTSLPFS